MSGPLPAAAAAAQGQPDITPACWTPPAGANPARVGSGSWVSFRWTALLVLGLELLVGPERALAQRPLGIDVSHWQGTAIDWAGVKSSGITFAWSKASEGTNYADDTFVTNQIKAVAAGVLIGAYHYADYDVNLGTAGAAAEASNFWSVAKNYLVGGGTYLMPMLNVEADTSAYDQTTLSQWVNKWCTTVSNSAAAVGITLRPVIYTSSSIAGSLLNSTVTNWTPWIANWNGEDAQTGSPSPWKPWSNWTFWQYTNALKVSGYSGHVDGDVFNGTSSGLTAYVIGGGTNAPTIATQPANTTVALNGTGSFTVVAYGSAPLSYQWQKNSNNLANGGHYSGCTTNTLTITGADNSDAASYRCVVTNAYGSITSSAATLTLTTNPPAAPVANAATGVTSNSFTANWSSASGATGYRLDVSTNSAFSTYVAGYQDLDEGNATSGSVSGLKASTTYYYRVRAYNGVGTSTNSATITVTTSSAVILCVGIVNADFEDGNTGGVANGWTAYQRPPYPGTAWSIQTSSPPPGGGLQYQQIANGSSTGGAGVRQDVTGCVIGGTYTISGWMRGNSTSDTTCTVKVSPTASTNWATAINLTPAATYSGANWTAFSGTVKATGTSMTIWLDGQTGGSGENKAECFDSIAVACTDIPAPLRFQLVALLAQKQVRMVVSGPTGNSVTVFWSSNLVDWVALTNLTNTAGTLQVTDTSASNVPQRFYRARTP